MPADPAIEADLAIVTIPAIGDTLLHEEEDIVVTDIPAEDGLMVAAPRVGMGAITVADIVS